VGDHKIDRADAKQNDHEVVEKAEVRPEIGDLSVHDILDHPYRYAKRQQAIELAWPGFQKSPDMELPGYKDPFRQVVNINGYGVAPLETFDKNKADHFRDKPETKEDIKGLIAFTYTAQTYQPYYDG
jgi:hypothetical protein